MVSRTGFSMLTTRHNHIISCIVASLLTVESRTTVNTWINRDYLKPKIPTKHTKYIHGQNSLPICTFLTTQNSLYSNTKHFTCNMPGGNRGKWVKVAQLCLTLCDLMDCSPPGSSVHEFSRQEYWSGFPFPSPGDHPHLGIEPRCPALHADSLPSEPPATSLYLQYAWR